MIISIFKKVALVAFTGIMAISFQGLAQRHGGFGGGHGGGHSSFGGSRGGNHSSFGGGGHSARPFAARPSGGFNRPVAHNFNHTVISRSNNIHRTTVVNNYHSTTVVNRGFVHGGYYGSPRSVGFYHPYRPVSLFGHPHFGYYYHPYRPYYWGPSWHPVGFFIGALATAAIVVSLNNHPYHYYNGVYYDSYNGGYRAIAAPVGVRINALPPGFTEVPVNGVSYYYYGGSYYRHFGADYQVVAPPFGAIVYNLPDGAQQVAVNGNNYMIYNNTYYQPITENGQDAYEVVDVRQQ